ncbi:uncharacterized protein LOC132201199 [Neocloeon triangulifer]|uniref:uncharacterized protein LOC132201199 n=1 Tax=Neocloeon triangulifer TaxID=2078957 RepID=UPI00286EC143|nr:uncharacterized protein LOC132201199 [Neocloeon triangulifer]
MAAKKPFITFGLKPNTLQVLFSNPKPTVEELQKLGMLELINFLCSNGLQEVKMHWLAPQLATAAWMMIDDLDKNTVLGPVPPGYVQNGPPNAGALGAALGAYNAPPAVGAAPGAFPTHAELAVHAGRLGAAFTALSEALKAPPAPAQH